MAEVADGTRGIEIAIVGLSLHLPGCGRPAAEAGCTALRDNLRRGVASISRFSDAQLAVAGVPPALRADPSYVPARGVLEGIELFDAAFFGYSPREAETIDPQHRLFLEGAWEALEDAGHDAARFPGSIGVFAGASACTYGAALRPDADADADRFQHDIGLGVDYLATRVSYKLDLTGPSFTVQTACSTSLVAVHLAAQALLTGECDMALAGGVSITVPQEAGYLHHAGSVLSPDGYCRAFDATAAGTVSGSGLGIVVLRRLEDACADGDRIYAVLRGSAINNDGADKVGFTAPSISGQVAVIEEAQAIAGVSAASIGYVEAHGTGTPLGDPIEVRALTEAFRATATGRAYCALGALKTNIGHLDAAAGVAGLIKATLSLHHRELYPSLFFHAANPELELEASPFYVNTTLQPWSDGDTPRRAAVSAFGVGGTNAHVVLEEAPVADADTPSWPYHLLLLSARTSTALEAASSRLVGHLDQCPDSALADLAFTLQVGRAELAQRRAVVVDSVSMAVERLGAVGAEGVFTATAPPRPRPVVFLLPGGGAQHVDMGRELYQVEPTFRRAVDRCAASFATTLGHDLRLDLYPEAGREREAAVALRGTAVGLPALFATEYALAQLWMSWGIAPAAMIGHSLGEYVAACLAGVLTLEDAIHLVALRSRLFASLPGGAMLSLSLSEAEARAHLGPSLSLAAINGPREVVASGPGAEIEVLASRLAAAGIEVRPVAIDVAAHSPLVEPILADFAAGAAGVCCGPPTIPYISNQSGCWITAEEVSDPDYWARHLRSTVRFADGLAALQQRLDDAILLEVGPGQALSSLARRQGVSERAFTSLPHATAPQTAAAWALTTLGRLWAAGTTVDWQGFYGGERRHRVTLPTYPFERQRYWLDAAPTPPPARATASSWTYLPSWRRASPAAPTAALPDAAPWLFFLDECGLGAALMAYIKAHGQTVIPVTLGAVFSSASEGYTLDPASPGDYQALFAALAARALQPARIVHLWSLHNGKVEAGRLQKLGYGSLLHLARAWLHGDWSWPLHIDVVTTGLLPVTGDEVLTPEQGTLMGPLRVLPQELPQAVARVFDIESLLGQEEQDLAAQLLAALRVDDGESVVALRGRHRWLPCYEPVSFDATAGRTRLREGGVYLITGGLGGLGLSVAAELARTVRARLVLISRRSKPAPTELDAAGAEILVLAADVSDPQAMAAALRTARTRFGRIDGVFHAAGLPGDDLIAFHGPAEMAPVLAPKVTGTRVLASLLATEPPDFLVLFSSLNALIGGAGQTAYCAANAFLDLFAHAAVGEESTQVVAIDWDTWRQAGMAVDAAARAPHERRWHGYLERAMPTRTALDVLFGALGGKVPQVVVSTEDLDAVLRRHRTADRFDRGTGRSQEHDGAGHPRPELDTAYTAPRDELEVHLADLWQEVLGVERVGVHDNFFELGGHSLLAGQILARLAHSRGVTLPLHRFFETVTIAGLARLIEALDGQALVEPEPVYLTEEMEEGQV